MYRFFNQQLLPTLGALALAWVLAPQAKGQILTRVWTAFEGYPRDVDEMPIPGVTVEGIEGARDVALSPDGEHVYVVGSLPVSGGSIAVFSRNTNDQLPDFGRVTFVEALFDDEGGTVFDGIVGLRGPRGVAVSPDGKHVYVAALIDNSIVVFSRNTTVGVDFGKLTHVHTIADAGVKGNPELSGAHGVIVSADGEHVYVASRAEDAIAVFSRDDSTGLLTAIESYINDEIDVTVGFNPETVTLSPDGKHLYVASEGDGSEDPGDPTPGSGSIAVFERETDLVSGDFGKLTFVETAVDGSAGVDGLSNACHVVVSPDGKHVYVGNNTETESDDWLGVFSRNETTGSLTFVAKLDAASANLCASAYGDVGVSSEVVLTPDGTTVIASNDSVGAVVSFSRDAVSGILTIADQECDRSIIVDPETMEEMIVANRGIVTINAVAISADGKHIYTTGLGAPASLVFLTNGIGSVLPDGQIGKKTTSLLGDGTYNTTAAGQKITVVSKKLKTAKFHGKIENDGDIVDRVGLRGTKGNKDFKFTYLLDGANVTAEIGKGTLEEILSPDEQRTLLLKAKPSRKLKNKKTGKIKRKKRNITITATSKVDGTKSDVVKGIVKAK